MGIIVPPDSTGKTVETNSPDGSTQRQVVTVGDKTTAANVARILASGAVSIEPAGVNSQPVISVPTTTGGTSEYHAVAAASNNAASIKGSAGQIYGWTIFNNAAYPIYVKLYNKATAPAPATDNALLVRTIGVQAGTHAPFFNLMGIPCSSGIGIAIVKGITDTDNTSVLLSDCVVDIDYK